MYEDYKIEKHEDHAVIYLPRKVFVPSSTGYRESLKSLFEEGYNKIIIDCKDLKMFDTAAMYWTATFQKKLRKNGGYVKFVNVVDPYIKQVFRTIELKKIVDIEEK